MSPAIQPVQRDEVWVGLAGGIVVAAGLVTSVVVAALAPDVAWVAPIVLVALAVTVLVLLQWSGVMSPLLPLSLVFGLAGLALQRSDGLQPTEILFAAFYLPYLAVWYALRVVVYPEPLARSSRDWAVVLFMVVVHASLGLSVMNHAEIELIRNDWIALSMIAFYFPVREVCVRYECGVQVVFWGILFLAFAAFVRNIFATRAAIETAAYAWEVARVRVTANEMTLTAGAVLCASVVASAPRRSWALAASFGFAILALGVVLTQWRAFYVVLAIGIVLVGLLSPTRGQVRILALVIVGGTFGAGFLYLLFGDALLLIAYGLLDRLLSIGTATTADVSLINRFYETKAVLARIAESPVIGHGMGTTFGFFDLTTMHTWVKPYAHNGYLTLWFKFGLVGLASILWVWGRGIVDLARTLRLGVAVRPFDRTVARATFGMLIAIIPSFAISNPLTTSDTVLCFALLTGLAAGIHDRYRAL